MYTFCSSKSSLWSRLKFKADADHIPVVTLSWRSMVLHQLDNWKQDTFLGVPSEFERRCWWEFWTEHVSCWEASKALNVDMRYRLWILAEPCDHLWVTPDFDTRSTHGTVQTSNFSRTIWLLVNIVFKVLLLVFTYLKHSEDKKIFSHGSCPPELEARKNLLVHEWEHLKRSTETYICSQVSRPRRYYIPIWVSRRVSHSTRKMANRFPTLWSTWSLIDLSPAVNHREASKTCKLEP